MATGRSGPRCRGGSDPGVVGDETFTTADVPDAQPTPERVAAVRPSVGLPFVQQAVLQTEAGATSAAGLGFGDEHLGQCSIIPA